MLGYTMGFRSEIVHAIWLASFADYLPKEISLSGRLDLSQSPSSFVSRQVTLPPITWISSIAEEILSHP